MKLWTIQREVAWELAQRRGVLRADGRRVWPEFRPPYRWLRGQMRWRVEGASGCYPVWAWHAPKPDLRHTAHLERGVRGVRIEFEAPADTVLLSDFDAWHCVLNGHFLALSVEEDHLFEARLERLEREQPATCGMKRALSGVARAMGGSCRVWYRDGYAPGVLRREIHASWERVFDLEALADSPYWHRENGDVQRVQATIERVALEQVIRVDSFVAR